jgi:hypothetical protein
MNPLKPLSPPTPPSPLTPLGDPNAIVCDGDSCVLPAGEEVAGAATEPARTPAATPDR